MILNKMNVQHWEMYLFTNCLFDIFYFTVMFMDILCCEKLWIAGETEK